MVFFEPGGILSTFPVLIQLIPSKTLGDRSLILFFHFTSEATEILGTCQDYQLGVGDRIQSRRLT